MNNKAAWINGDWWSENVYICLYICLLQESENVYICWYICYRNLDEPLMTFNLNRELILAASKTV